MFGGTIGTKLRGVAEQALETVAHEARPVPWRNDVPTRPIYMRDVPQIEAELADLATTHGSRARLMKIGESSLKVNSGGKEGHDIFALVLGEHADDPTVPRIMHVAGIHPRELANPALLLDWSRATLEAAAAGDPARLAMLRQRTIIVVPIANPDALDVVSHGLATGNMKEIYHRGNVGKNGAVDLARNFDAGFGAGDAVPGKQNYHGPYPFSESETQALRGVGELYRPKGVYDWHSPSGMVMESSMPGAPGAVDAKAMAKLVGHVTGFEVMPSDQHWDEHVAGTLKDWAREKLGAVSLTIETGTSHHQTDIQYLDTKSRGFAALDAIGASVDGHTAVPDELRTFIDVPARDIYVAMEHTQGTVTTLEKPKGAKDGED